MSQRILAKAEGHPNLMAKDFSLEIPSTRSEKVWTKIFKEGFEQEGFFLVERGTTQLFLPNKEATKVINNSYTDEDLKEWMDSDFGDFKEIADEVRAELFSVVPTDRLNEVYDFKVLDKISGEELYKNNPIKNYIQQGDVLMFPEDSRLVSFEELDDEMKIRIVANCYYELITTTIGEYRRTFLKMHNASWYSQQKTIHIEGVPRDTKTVFEAICYRNKSDALPFRLS